MKFSESTLVENFIVEAKALGTLLQPTDVLRVCEAVMLSTGQFLRIVQSEEDVALVFDNVKDEMIMAAVCEYNKNENSDAQDNFNFYFTFDPKQIEGIKTYKISSTQVQSFIAKCAYENFKFKFSLPNLIVDYSVLFANLIKEFLTTNASTNKDEPFVVEHDGYFKGVSTVEEGISLIPGSLTKKEVKDDDKTQKLA